MMPVPRRRVVLVVQLRLAWLVAGPLAGVQLGCMGKSRRAEAESPPPLPPGPTVRPRADPRLRPPGHRRQGTRLRPGARPDRGVRQRRHALGRAPDPVPAHVRHRSGQGDDGRRPRAGGQAAVQALLGGEMPAINEQEIAALMAETHSGMTPEEFVKIAQTWLATARHPRFGRSPPPAPISRSSSFWASCGSTASRSSSSRGAASISSAPSPTRPTAFRPSRWSGRAARPSSRSSAARRR